MIFKEMAKEEINSFLLKKYRETVKLEDGKSMLSRLEDLMRKEIELEGARVELANFRYDTKLAAFGLVDILSAGDDQDLFNYIRTNRIGRTRLEQQVKDQQHQIEQLRKALDDAIADPDDIELTASFIDNYVPESDNVYLCEVDSCKYTGAAKWRYEGREDVDVPGWICDSCYREAFQFSLHVDNG